MLHFITATFAAYFFINLLRVLPILRDLYVQGKKPLSCDVCMTFWTLVTLCVVSYYFGPHSELKLCGPIAGAVLTLLRAFPQSPERPPTLTPDA
jgi:hypothetical protein